MIFNYISIGLAALFLVLSIICVIAECFPPKDKPLRRLKITLREVTKLPFAVIALIVLLIGSKVSGAETWLTAAALGIFLIGLVILHWFRLTALLRSRRLKKAKSPDTAVKRSRLSRNSAAETPLAPLAKELEPLEPKVIDAAPSES